MMKKLFTIALVVLCTLFAIIVTIIFNSEVVPARVEVQWEQQFSREDLAASTSTLPPDMANKFTQINEYRVTSSLAHSSQQLKRTFHIVFNKAFSNDEANAILPKLTAILDGQNYQISVHQQHRKFNLPLFGFLVFRIDGNTATFRINGKSSTQ